MMFIYVVRVRKKAHRVLDVFMDRFAAGSTKAWRQCFLWISSASKSRGQRNDVLQRAKMPLVQIIHIEIVRGPVDRA